MAKLIVYDIIVNDINSEEDIMAKEGLSIQVMQAMLAGAEE